MYYEPQKIGLKRTLDAASEPVTLSEAKTHLRIDHSDDDTYITGLIIAARNLAESITNRSFFTQTWVTTFTFFSKYNVVELRRGDVKSITSIEYYNEANELVEWPSSNYILNNSGDISYVDAINDFPTNTYDRTDAVKITYVAGWDDVSDIPAAIKQAILILIGNMYEIRQDVVVGSQVNKVPFTAEALLNAYTIRHQY